MQCTIPRILRFRNLIFNRGEYGDAAVGPMDVGPPGRRRCADVRSQNGDFELQLWAMFAATTCQNTSR